MAAVRKAAVGGFLLCPALLLALAWSVRTAAAETLEFEVARAVAAFDQRISEPIIMFTLTEPSRRMFAEFTAQNVGRTIEFRADGRVLMRPVVREPILGGSGQISGGFTVDAANELAGRLSSGAIKLEIEAMPN